ncbi:hypothetical protein [Phyllobacterium chamaecytisi]|uniref:hypothetical protein n=1 Tax=Phyllobacterium chamaecytisi TaxID=2876082 RepID=UPI001CCE749C|nr:hypothetical protein [Phyllobacterium sp. KW56]MBZ9603311.1 hypothetical protein [Phyllobacterium sp. KW56]
MQNKGGLAGWVATDLSVDTMTVTDIKLARGVRFYVWVKDGHQRRYRSFLYYFYDDRHRLHRYQRWSVADGEKRAKS